MRNYRDLQVWLKAHTLTLEVYRSTQCFPSDERFGLTSQMRRSCSSIPANLAEGCGRRSDGEMARFVQIAMGSGAELSYHLLLSRDLGLLKPADCAHLESELNAVMRMLSALSQKLRNTRAA
ncbi:MAG: four helix bundle protein [Terriglobales bacterium]